MSDAEAVATPCRIAPVQAEVVLRGASTGLAIHDRNEPCGYGAGGIPTFVEFVEDAADGDVELNECQHCWETTTPEDAIVAALDDAVELSTRDLLEQIDITKSSLYNHLSQLQADDTIQARPDPDHGNRKLFSLPGYDPDVEDDGVEEDHETEPEDTNADNGDDDDDEPDGDGGDYYPYPRECIECGEVTVKNSFEEAIHRTEVHGTTQSSLDYMEPGEFETAVEAADSVGEIADALGWSYERSMRGLGVYGLADVVGGDVELSDITDFDFDGIGDDDASATSAKATDAATADGGAEPSRPSLDVDVDPGALADAIVRAQSVHQVRREFQHLSRDRLEEVLEAVGYLEDLKRGGFNPERDAVIERVKKVVT